MPRPLDHLVEHMLIDVQKAIPGVDKFLYTFRYCRTGMFQHIGITKVRSPLPMFGLDIGLMLPNRRRVPVTRHVGGISLIKFS